jgi:hypothetical protein
LGTNKKPEIIGSARLPELLEALAAAKDGDRPYVRTLIDRANGLIFAEGKGQEMLRRGLANLSVSQCYSCNKVAVWRHEKLVYPNDAAGEEAQPDMPDDVRADYDEARSIVNASPRGAAALLRLAIQKLCVHLGEPGKNINTDIGSLVAKGLPKQIEQALDAVRVIGNEAVHPGELDLRDDRETVFRLFRVINVVIDNRISQPKQIDELYDMIPARKTAEIEARNANAANKLAQDPKA